MTRLPCLRLDLDRLQHNIAVMSAWCAAAGVELWPHLKTTMSRPIMAEQLGAGASGVTVATVEQAEIVASWGARTILVANEVVDPDSLRRLRSLSDSDESDEGLRLACFVDSAPGVASASRVFATAAPPLEVLVDVGSPGGRTGVRTLVEAREIAERAADAPGLDLIGVAGYEGVVPNRRDAETLSAIDRHCARVRDAFVALRDHYRGEAPVLTLGGSAFPDRVVAHLPGPGDVPGSVTVLRSGCYVTHDHGTYAGVSPVAGLRPALTVRAVVVSTPEPGLAVLGAGRRELPHDAGLPIVLSVRTADGRDLDEAGGAVRTLFDHHATVEDARGLSVGDVVDLGISHPCSAFSRWDRFDVHAAGERVATWTTCFHTDD